MARRRTLKRYADLYREPTSLFPEVKTVLFPNGANEIWFSTADGLGFKLIVSNGPHGLGFEMRSFVGSPHLVAEATNQEDFYIAGTQYRQTAKAQAFRRWYHHNETEADIEILGPEYRRGFGKTVQYHPRDED